MNRPSLILKHFIPQGLIDIHEGIYLGNFVTNGPCHSKWIEFRCQLNTATPTLHPSTGESPRKAISIHTSRKRSRVAVSSRPSQAVIRQTVYMKKNKNTKTDGSLRGWASLAGNIKAGNWVDLCNAGAQSRGWGGCSHSSTFPIELSQYPSPIKTARDLRWVAWVRRCRSECSFISSLNLSHDFSY